jgi:hypothetical protein
VVARISERLREAAVWVSLVWTPILPADNLESAGQAALEFDAGHVRQFYDGGRVLGRNVGEMLGADGKIAWDVYLVYAPDVTWSAQFPPPSEWVHQLDADWADPERHHKGQDLVRALDEVVRRYIM